MEKYYLKSNEEVLKLVDSTDHGLTSQEAAKRLQENGKNKLEEAKKCTARIIALGGKPESLFDIVSSLCNKTAESAKTVYRIIDGEEDLRYNANDQKCGIRNFKHQSTSLRLRSHGDQERYIPEQTDIEET